MTAWLAPVLLCASLLLLSWSFFNIYVRGIRSRATVIIVWLSLAFIIGFWTWYLVSGGWPMGTEAEATSSPVKEAAKDVRKAPPRSASAGAQKVTLHVPDMTERLALT